MPEFHISKTERRSGRIEIYSEMYETDSGCWWYVKHQHSGMSWSGRADTALEACDQMYTAVAEAAKAVGARMSGEMMIVTFRDE